MVNNEQIILNEYNINKQAYIKVARNITKDRISAEDIVQDAFLGALKKADTFDSNRSVSDWMFICVKNQALMHIRKIAIEKKYIIYVDALDQIRTYQQNKEDSTEINIIKSEEHTETLTNLNIAIEVLPEKMKKAVKLRYLQEMPGKQVSQKMGCGLMAAHLSWLRGLEKMKKSLAKKEVVSYSLIDVLL